MHLILRQPQAGAGSHRAEGAPSRTRSCQAQADIRGGRYFEASKDAKLAVGALLERYLKEYAVLHKQPRTYKRYTEAAKVLCERFGERLVKDVQLEDVHRFILERKEVGVAHASINIELTALSAAFTWANKLKLTTRHPCRGIGRLKGNRKGRYLTNEEIQCFLDARNGDFRDIVVLALGTGMRASEVLSLSRDNIEVRNRVVVFGDSKNGDRRVVHLPQRVIEVLVSRSLPIRELFPGWTLGALHANCLRTARCAGLPGVTFHTLRHTFASHAVTAGVDLYTLAKLLGHRTVAMVQRYAHLAPAHLKTATDASARAIFAEEVPQ
jgi:integrase